MNLKKLIVFLVLSLFCIPTVFVFAEDNNLEIEEGKNLLFDFKIGDKATHNIWYNDTEVYANVNIGAGTKVVLNSDWEYMYKGENTYALEENLATLSISENGKIILNSGSELSLRNQYNLVTSVNNVSLQYQQLDDKISFISEKSLNIDSFTYVGSKKEYTNMKSGTKLTANNLFKGDIIFENGDADTKLTFRGVSDKTSEDRVLPEAKEGDEINTIETVTIDDTNNRSLIENNFVINSNRAVINVDFDGSREAGEWDSTCGHVGLGRDGGFSYLYGDGTIVKQGAGVLDLRWEDKDNDIENIHIHVDGSGLTGKNTGYAWWIEEGKVRAAYQVNLGTAAIYIASEGTLSLSKGDAIDPANAITQIKNGLSTNIFENNITSDGGGISIASSSSIELSGTLDTIGDNSDLRFSFYRQSALVLSGENDAKIFSINFGGSKGGEANYLITDVAGLASDSITVKNTTAEDLKDFSFFELVLNEISDTSYSGSLNGEMYLHKLGTGTVTLSGNNTYDKGTYITEGGLLLATSNSIGTGNILFDNDTENPEDFASIGVAEGGNIDLINNIHVKKGAILNVLEGQNMYLKGDLVRYDARPGYEAKFIKNGLGNAIISQIEGVDRKINISSFNVTEGGFILDKGVASDSYFSLDGQQAFLEVRENAEIKNNRIDINNGDLIIFNDNCISSATAVNFNDDISSSTETFSKFHIVSDSIISDETIDGTITIAKSINFVTDATTTAKMNKFVFGSTTTSVIPTIVKSGSGTFIADGGGDFEVNNLYVNGGKFRIENTTMTVSGITSLDEGILSISEGSHFSNSENKITVLDGGGIGIFDQSSIDESIELRFEGESEENLSKLIIEKADAEIHNNIYVNTGVIIENENNFKLSGVSIDYKEGAAGILAKAGEGTMTINTGTATFKMGELRALEGDLLIESDIKVSTLSIRGENALLSFNGENKAITATISDYLFLESGGILSISTATVKASNLDLEDAQIIINKSSELNATNVKFDASSINLTDMSSVIKAETIYLINGSSVTGYGKLDSIVNVGNDSDIYVGSKGTTGENLKAAEIIFESGSSLYIDIDDENGISDKLEVLGDLTVQKNVTLHVNFIGDNEEADGVSDINFANDNSSGKAKEFEILTFNGNYNFANPTNEIFNIVLSDKSLSASTSLVGNSIFLQIVQAWGDLYNIPGVTKNQQEMIDLFNGLTVDDVESMRPLIDTIRGYYTTYVNTGDKSVFLNALQDLSGIFYANSFMTSAMLSKANILYNRLNENSDEREEDNRVWAQVYTNNFSVSESDENPEFKNSIYGIIAGYDTVQDESLVFGVAGFYGQGELKQLDDKADFVDAGLNVYGDYKVNDNIDVKGLIGYSMQDYDTTRKLRFNKQEITSKYATNTINFDLEAAYKFNLSDRFLLKPLVGANCAIVSNGDIEEDGDTIQKLKIKKGTYSRAEARVGVGLQGISDSPFNWHVSAAIKHVVSGNKFTTKSYFVEAPGYEFEIESTEVAGTSFSGLFGCSYDINSNINVSLDLNADAGAVSQFGGNIGASYRW